MDERLWNDVKTMVDKKIRERNPFAETKAQNQKFQLIKVTDDFIRVSRNRSKLPFEDIPKEDFIDIWADLQKAGHKARGYQQSDLHNRQNRHTAVSFALVGMLPYIEWRRVGKAWKLFLKS